MRRLWNTFLKGLAAVLPVALTVYRRLLARRARPSRILSGPLRALLPEDRYWPGLGLLVGFLLVLLVGVIVDAYVVRRLFRFGESLLARIPIVKTIFGALQGHHALPAGGRQSARSEARRAVALRQRAADRLRHGRARQHAPVRRQRRRTWWPCTFR